LNPFEVDLHGPDGGPDLQKNPLLQVLEVDQGLLVADFRGLVLGPEVKKETGTLS